MLQWQIDTKNNRKKGDIRVVKIAVYTMLIISASLRTLFQHHFFAANCIKNNSFASFFRSVISKIKNHRFNSVTDDRFCQ